MNWCVFFFPLSRFAELWHSRYSRTHMRELGWWRVKNMKSTHNHKSPSHYHTWTKCAMRIRNGLMISQFLFIRFFFFFHFSYSTFAFLREFKNIYSSHGFFIKSHLFSTVAPRIVWPKTFKNNDIFINCSNLVRLLFFSAPFFFITMSRKTVLEYIQLMRSS